MVAYFVAAQSLKCDGKVVDNLLITDVGNVKNCSWLGDADAMYF